MAANYDDGLALKHAALEEGFETLQESAEQVAASLRKANETKRFLQAEVSFLQKRVKLLKESTTDNRIRNSVLNVEPAIQSSERSKLTECPPQPAFVEGGVKKAMSQPSLRHLSKKKEIVGVLKPSSLKHGLNGFPVNESKGKRKISWQDERFHKV